MRLSSLSPIQLSGAQITLAALLSIIGFLLLLPRPRGRFIPGGIAFLIASIAAFGVWLYSTFGRPMPDAISKSSSFFSRSVLWSSAQCWWFSGTRLAARSPLPSSS